MMMRSAMRRSCPEICSAIIAHGGLDVTPAWFSPNWPARLEAVVPRTRGAGVVLLGGVALRRKASLFVGSDSGACHGAIAMAPLQTAKLNGAEPRTWLTFAPIADIRLSGRIR